MTRAPFRVIPSVDILDGRAVRLLRGSFDDVTVYGDPVELARSWNAEPGTLVHVVDLEGSRRGEPTALGTVGRLASIGFTVQAGGGIRSAAGATAWIAAGASRIVIGTAAAADDRRLEEIVAAVGAERVVPAVDMRNGEIRVEGWERRAALSARDVFERVRTLGIREVIVTDIGADGTMQGPSLDLYRALGEPQGNPMSGAIDQAGHRNVRPPGIIASGGVGTMADLVALARLGNVSGVVIGKALHEGRITYRAAADRVTQAELPPRVIPCLDIRGGRVVKGVRFEGLRDAGDPVEQARRYEAEGADEICVLDVSATTEERAASLEVVRAISETLFIPLSVGGGVRSIDDFRALLRAGADRVGINTAALRDPELIARCAREFGRQAVVLSCDARRTGEGYRAVARSGTDTTSVDAVEWCERAEELGAGEILLTSVDRDGTENGFDIDLLRLVTARLRIGVIASGGAGSVEHFAEAIERGGANAVLAASLFHDRKLSVGEVKEYLGGIGIPVRSTALPLTFSRYAGS